MEHLNPRKWKMVENTVLKELSGIPRKGQIVSILGESYKVLVVDNWPEQGVVTSQANRCNMCALEKSGEACCNKPFVCCQQVYKGNQMIDHYFIFEKVDPIEHMIAAVQEEEQKEDRKIRMFEALSKRAIRIKKSWRNTWKSK